MPFRKPGRTFLSLLAFENHVSKILLNSHLFHLIMKRPAQTTIVLVLLLLWGCAKDPIAIQEKVPKEYESLDLRWTLPEGWTEAQTTSSMQMAAFSIAAGEGTLQCTITSFVGGGGSDLDNLNRWFRQLGRPATDANGLANLRNNLFLGTHAFVFFDLTDDTQPTGKQFLAAILRENNRSWFFKLQGGLEEVRSQVGPFKAFLAGIRLQGEPDEIELSPKKHIPHAVSAAGGVKILRKGAVPPGAPPPPSGPPPLPPGGLPPPPSIPPEILEKMKKTPPPNIPAQLQKRLGSVKTPAWKVPDGWKTLSSTPTRRGNFTIAGEDGKAAVVRVVRLPANLGSLDANITNWGSEIGLRQEELNKNQPPVQQMVVGGVKTTYVVLRGPEKSTAVAIVRQGGGTWYFKLTGDNPVVEKQRDAFEGFLKTVKF